MTEAEVRRYAARALSELFDSLYEGAFAIDTGGRVTWMNHKFKALIGWNGTEAIEGQPIDEVLPHSQMNRVLETGRADLLDIIPLGRRQPAGNSLLLEGRRRHGGPVDWPRGGGDRAGPAAALGGGDRPAEAGPAGGEKRAMTEEVPKGEEASWS